MNEAWVGSYRLYAVAIFTFQYSFKMTLQHGGQNRQYERQKPRDCVRNWDTLSRGQWRMLVKRSHYKNPDTFDWIDLREGAFTLAPKGQVDF